ncbi:MAG: SseB family protein [Janthinobacterium lividum]
MDVNEPITNPVLVAAFDALVRHDTPDTRLQVGLELEKANFLVAMFDDELKLTKERGSPGVSIAAGSLLKVLTCITPDGKVLLPLFTDWEALRAYTTEPLAGWIMPAAQAWEFALQDDTYAGAVVNPATHDIVLPRQALENIVRPGQAAG